MRGRTMSASGLVRASGRAFTLMEMMVGVGAVAIVAVGLAAIFNSVGKTVSGGRRVSVMNTYSTLIESQMRRDFESMARDGFLVIRHQWVDPPTGTTAGFRDGNDVIPVSPSQKASAAQPRRADELQFGIVGKLETARQPLIPGVKATSNEAVVYYGHGEKGPPPGSAPAGSNFKKRRPTVQDSYQLPGGTLATSTKLGFPGENQYCGDWVLLRHVTLLANPDSALYNPVPTTSGTPFGVTDFNLVRNQRTQYALQPAASSLFRSIAARFPDGASGLIHDDPSQTLRASIGSLSELHPLRSSGIVDIASSSFSQVRAMVTTCNGVPIPGMPAEPLPDRVFNPVSYNSFGNDLDNMHAWLADTLPTDSRNPDSAAARVSGASNGVDTLVPATAQSGHRIRFEPDAVDLLTAVTMPGSGPSPAFDKATARADQLMLSNSNFVPHCTSFVVDWTYGTIDNSGNVVWYGLDTNGARPYGIGTTVTGSAPYADLLNITFTDNSTTPPTSLTHPVTPRLIYGVDGPFLQTNALISELTAYFGYVDPTFAPAFASIPAPVAVSPTSTVLNWAWPKMIRVKVTLADPVDYSETTFTYVFDVPDETGRKIREAS